MATDTPTDCGCADGVLVDQTYGHTDPPEEGVLIQRCDACDRHPGDVDAALAHARTTGGVVHAVGDGELLADLSDPWVMPGPGSDEVVWHPVADATAAGTYLPEEE